jgi:hypothetical protein
MVGWLGGSGPAAAATAVLAGVVASPLFTWVVMVLTRSRRDGSPSRLTTLRGQGKTNFAQAGLKVAFLLDQALLMSDAIGRTLYRSFPRAVKIKMSKL